MTVVLLLVGAVVLAAVGAVGSVNLDVLSSQGEHFHRRDVLRRGCHTCYAIAALFVVGAIVRML
ncbi:hypothetical protein [Amycolatopsis benzoatilytica]|uniref:hypothetical protein n=1 Tax=Amycolatopsis benzoatilytica TaxID=346045 RepID=UPI00037DC67A|nr:hypothetical protein [Amycolatopsis benzoatilytica]